MLLATLYTEEVWLRHDFWAGPHLLADSIRAIIADELTVRRDELRPDKNRTEPDPPLDPDAVKIIVHLTNISLGDHTNAHYFVTINGAPNQTSRDCSLAMAVRQRIIEIVPDGRTVDVRLV